jgi:hypothetical protein
MPTVRRPPWWNHGVDVAAPLVEHFGRIPPMERRVVVGFDAVTLLDATAPLATTGAWRVGHLACVHDGPSGEIVDDDPVRVERGGPP